MKKYKQFTNDIELITFTRQNSLIKLNSKLYSKLWNDNFQKILRSDIGLNLIDNLDQELRNET